MNIERLVSYDRALLLAINGLQGNPTADRLFLVATTVGTAWLAFPVAVGAILLSQRQDKRSLWCRAILSTAAAAVVTVGLKVLVGRDRPPRALPSAVRVLGPRLELFSFPSGHTLTVFAVLGFLWALDRRLATAWLPVACIVGFSRVYLGVHYPSDVVAGAVIGFIPPWLLSLGKQQE